MRITLSISEELNKELHQYCQLNGFTLSGLCRSLILDKLEKNTPQARLATAKKALKTVSKGGKLTMCQHGILKDGFCRRCENEER